MNIKILWITSRFFEPESEKRSGVWIKALAMMLSKHTQIQLANLTVQHKISETVFSEFEGIKQWIVPSGKISKSGYPDNNTIKEVTKIISEFNPDIVQIWGSENPLKLLPFMEQIPGKKVLTMQGVLSSIAPTIFAGLSFRELISTVGIRELIFKDGVVFDKKSFSHEGYIETEMIKRCPYIITQSDWTESQIRFIHPQAKYYRTNRVLRSEFLSAKKWINFDHQKPILYSAAIGYSLKGLHILLRALTLLKKQFPDIELRLAGSIGRIDFLGSGYLRFLNRYISKHQLDKNIKWIGAISACQIVEQLQQASVFINPSYIESYSLTLAEAMTIGTPSVLSFAGAMPELADNNVEALFFTPGDYKRCAYLIAKLISMPVLSKELSINAVERAKKRNIDVDIVEQQIQIYADIMQHAQ